MDTYRSNIGETAQYNQQGEQEYDTRPSAPNEEILPAWQDSFHIPEVKWMTTYVVSHRYDIPPNLPDGNWALTTPNNYVFARVQIRGNELNGIAIKYKKNAIKSIGNYIDGIGCTMCFLNGKMVYHGYVKNNKAHYYGILRTNLFTYKGEFVQGVRSGRGTIHYKNGDKYKGDFKNNMRTGRGVIERKNGDMYIGQFKNNKTHGYGKTLYKNGNFHEGIYKHGKRNGHGKVVLSSGQTYVGEFVDNKAHGKGELLFVNGNLYKGNFENNKAHGQGSLTRGDGTIIEGYFRKGDLVRDHYLRQDMLSGCLMM